MHILESWVAKHVVTLAERAHFRALGIVKETSEIFQAATFVADCTAQLEVALQPPCAFKHVQCNIHATSAVLRRCAIDDDPVQRRNALACLVALAPHLVAGEAAADADGAFGGGDATAAGPGGSDVPGLIWQGAGALIDFDVDGPFYEDATFLHLMCAAMVRPRGTLHVLRAK